MKIFCIERTFLFDIDIVITLILILNQYCDITIFNKVGTLHNNITTIF